MKRKLLLALIALTCALCLVFNLAGCNPAENQSGTQQETPGGQGGEQQGGNSDDEKPDTHNYIFKCSQTEHWQVCTDCGEGTAHTPHSVSDGVCPACGYVEKCTAGLEFTEVKNNEEIIGYYVLKCTATDSHLFIPSFYNNLPVISIGDYAFYECENLESVTIGNSVTFIGEGAFYACTSLTEITIPDSVTSIGYMAFYDTAYYNDDTNWKNDVLYEVLYIGNCLIEAKASGSYQITPGTKLIADVAFMECKTLTEITIPDSVTSIGYQAFLYCISLESITVDKENKVYRSEDNCIIETETKTLIVGCKTSKIPEYVTSIGDYAFYGCSLREITIPDSVTFIGYDAFNGCLNLESITVSEGNQTYSSQDGILYNKNKTEIIYIPKAIKGSIIIPDGVTSIGDWAFYNCTNLTEIIISQGVTSIDSNAFYGCTSLTEITIPDSVTSIGCWAFSDCTSLERVIFENNAGWKVSESYDMANFEEINVSDPEQNAENLKDKYSGYFWKRGE